MIGIDLVFVPEFQRRVASGGDGFLRRTFRESPREAWSFQHRAGLWAVKEAVTKSALETPRRLREIEITCDVSGRPHATDQDQFFGISKSHRGDYAPAAALRVTS